MNGCGFVVFCKSYTRNPSLNLTVLSHLRRSRFVGRHSSSRTQNVSYSDVGFCRDCFRNQHFYIKGRLRKFTSQFLIISRHLTSGNNGGDNDAHKPNKTSGDSSDVKSKISLEKLIAGSIYDGPSSKFYKKNFPEIDYTKKHHHNTFISDTRAMSDYLLKPSDMEGIRAQALRSAYTKTQDSPDRYYLKSDVEKKSYEIWGGQEGLAKEIWNRRKALEEDEKFRKGLAALIGHLKKSVKDHSKRSHDHMLFGKRIERETLLRGSARVVGYAMLSNLAVMMFKFVGYLYTGSATMLSESIHSLADLLNQCLLAIGIRQSIKKPSSDHPLIIRHAVFKEAVFKFMLISVNSFLCRDDIHVHVISINKQMN